MLSSKDIDNISRKAIQQSSLEDKLSVLTHETRRFGDSIGAMAAYFGITDSANTYGLPNDFNKWAELLTRVTRDLHATLDTCLNTLRQQRGMIQQIDLEELLSNLLFESHKTLDITKDATVFFTTINTEQIHGLHSDFSQWVERLVKVTQDYQRVLAMYD